jgi:hypothetical protein
MKKLFIIFAVSLFAFTITVSAQPRPVEKAVEKEDIKPAPQTIETKYYGGIFGFSEKEKGTLKFDDTNQRLVFYDKENKELFGINYASMLVVAPSSKKVQSGAGRTIGAIPIPGAGIGGSFIKKKKNYLVIQFRDQDVDIQGTVNFLIDTDELLKSVVHTLGEKAEMTQRGDAFFRSRNTTDSN